MGKLESRETTQNSWSSRSLCRRCLESTMFIKANWMSILASLRRGNPEGLAGLQKIYLGQLESRNFIQANWSPQILYWLQETEEVFKTQLKSRQFIQTSWISQGSMQASWSSAGLNRLGEVLGIYICQMRVLRISSNQFLYNYPLTTQLFYRPVSPSTNLLTSQLLYKDFLTH